jgi:hypothetical protein
MGSHGTGGTDLCRAHRQTGKYLGAGDQAPRPFRTTIYRGVLASAARFADLVFAPVGRHFSCRIPGESEKRPKTIFLSMFIVSRH